MVPVSARMRRLVAAVPLAVAACAPSPVEWSEGRTLTFGSPAMALSPGGALVTDSMNLAEASVTPPVSACAGSLRLARSGGNTLAVWWSPRLDSSARLLFAHSPDGGRSWSSVVPVDTSDRGVSGCRRAPPAITADAASGYVHVTYGMVAPEGPGLFFSHSMDGGVLFHAPVPILYGERLGHTSVAAAGDLVAVAFEDPNSATPRIGLALSRTMGHIFEDRILPVSDDNGTATHPLVALQGRRMTVAWRQRTAANGSVVLRVRSGTLH